MAKYISQCGWVLNSNYWLGVAGRNLEDILKTDIPQNSRKHVQEALMHINSAIIQLSHASRTLIEADAEESAKAKED